jgi:2-polyprenyl-3-methyl-5-hydroxy-6-metoxy-1,4-benzoquinol methylase
MSKMESSVIENLSENAGAFAEKYSYDQNFIQRFNVWTNVVDRYSQHVTTAYDMGCGTGIFSFFLASKGIQTTGFDGAKGMIEQCNRTKEEKQVSNVGFRLTMLPIADYTSLPRVDLIISSSVVEYIDDMDSTIKMFHDLLKPNGKLIVSFPNKDAIYRKMEMGMYRVFRRPDYFRFVKNIWTKPEAENLFGKAGFNAVESFYFSDRSVISRMARLAGGSRRAGNLTMMVFNKKK